MKKSAVVQMEERTARLTILIDPRKKAVFEQLCSQEDLTSSQVVRRMVRSYIEERTGERWSAGRHNSPNGSGAAGARNQARRRTPRP